MPEKTEKEKLDLHEYQQKIIQRLIDKRRQDETQRKQLEEAERIQERAFRVEWKALHKEKTNEKIASRVDSAILKNSITRHPDIILKLNKKMAGDLSVTNEQSLSGLVFPTDSMNLVSENVKEESFLLTKRHDIVLSNSYAEGSSSDSTKTRKAFQLQSKSTSALCFLQKTATFNLSINNRMKGKSSISPHELSFSSYDKASQANDMMWGLIGDTEFLRPAPPPPPISGGSTTTTPAKEGPTRRASCEDLTKIRTVGLMAQFLNDGSNAGTAAAYNWQGADFLSPMLRTQSFINNYLGPGASKPASFSVGAGGGGIAGLPSTPGPMAPATPSHSVSGTAGATTDGGAAAAAAAGGEGHSAMFCSMVDTVFLIGPTKRTIYDYVPIKLKSQEGRVENQETIKAVVDPSILFMTECDNPAEMLSLLPSYCFPSGADLTVQPVQIPTPPPTTASVSSTRVLMRKTSMTGGGMNSPPTPQTGKSSSKSKKLKAFFPSDFSLMETGAAAVASAAATAAVSVANSGASLLKSNTAANAATMTSPPFTGSSSVKAPAAAAAATKSAPFVLMFGDHTYSQYCLGMQLPMTFQDHKNDVLITTTYVVCFMTKLPLFNYLFHILEQFESVHRGYQFSEPFPLHDENFAVHPELRLLSDFAARLKKMTVPLFPYLIPILESYKRTGHQKLLAEHPDLLTTEDYNAVLPDVEFLFVNRANTNVKIDLPFRRSVYQSYFSSIAAEYNPFNPEQTKVINAHKNAVNKFIASSTHRSEREKEDTFMILLWALPVLLRYLPLDQIILALGCAVTEMRIVVKHKDFHVVSSVILALIYLLKPLKWCSPVIVILPDNLADFIESPVPIIIGLQKLPDNFVLLERFVVIDPQERIVHLNPTDVVMAHTILLPHAPKLVNVLTAPRETILKLTKRKKNPKLKKTVHLMMPLTPGASPVIDDKAIEAAAESQYPSKFADADSVNGRRRKISINTITEQGGAGFPEPAAIMSPQMPLPVELDIGASDNTLLLTAVKQFSTLVSNHIEAIINTAIHMQHDEKMKARAKRTVLSGGNTNSRDQTRTTSHKSPVPVSGKKTPPKPLTPEDASSPTAAALAAANAAQAQAAAAIASTITSTSAAAAVASVGADVGSSPLRRESLMTKSSSDPQATFKPSPLHATSASASGVSPAASNDKIKQEEPLPAPLSRSKEPLVLNKENLMECSVLPPLSPFRDGSPTGRTSLRAPPPQPPVLAAPVRKRASSEPGSPNDDLVARKVAPRKSLGSHELPVRRASPDITAQRNQHQHQQRRVSPHANAAAAASSSDAVGRKRHSPHHSEIGSRKGSPHQEPSSRLLKSSLVGHSLAVDKKGSKPSTPQSGHGSIGSSDRHKLNSPRKPGSATSVAARVTKVLDAYETTKQRNKEFSVDLHGHIKKDGNKAPRASASNSPVRKRAKNATGAASSQPKSTPSVDALQAGVTAAPGAAMASDSATGISASASSESAASVVSTGDLNVAVLSGAAAAAPAKSGEDPLSSSSSSPRAAKSASAYLEDVPPAVITVDRRHTEPVSTSKVISPINFPPPVVSPLSEKTTKSLSPEMEMVPEGVEDNESTSDEPSIASTSSSLPSLRLNAPVMAMKEIGQGGAKFVAQLVETQMYCNYCQNLKVEAAALAAINAEKEALKELGLASHSEELGPVMNEVSDAVLNQMSNLVTPSGKGGAGGGVRSRMLSRTRSMSAASLVDETLELDAITSVFDVMVCGTLPMDVVTVNIEVNRYRELYGEFDYSKSAEVYASYEGPILDKVRNMSTSVGHYSDDCRPEEDLQQQQEHTAEPSPEEQTPPSPLLWCNGLVCRGLCNTPMCSPICIQLWESNVQKLRHQAVLEEIVNKRHHSDLVMKKHRIPDRKAVSGASAGNVVKVSLKPQLEAVKHPMETQSQYEQRKAIIKASSLSEKEKTQAMLQMKQQHERAVKAVRVTGPKIVSKSLGQKTRKCLYASSSTADPATLLIAQYYAEKQSRILVQRRKKAMRIVKRFLCKFVRLYRKVKFFDCVVRVQAFVRGYIIRYYIASIVEALIARKTDRLLACIRIRNYIRKHVVQILKKRAKVKNAELMKKRAALSLPVRSSSPMLARVQSPPAPEASASAASGGAAAAAVGSVAGIKSPQTAANTRKQMPSHIIQDGGDSEGGFVSQLYNKASRVASPLKTLGGVRGPSPLKATPHSSAAAGTTAAAGSMSPSPASGVSVSEKTPDKTGPAIMPAKSRSVNFEKPTSTMETLFGKLGDDKRRDSQKADTTLIDKLNAGYDAAMKRSSMSSVHSIEDEEGVGGDVGGGKKYSKRTYSEKALDFLQFGKILKRNGSTGGNKKRSSLFGLSSGRNSGASFFSNESTASSTSATSTGSAGSSSNTAATATLEFYSTSSSTARPEKKLSKIEEVRSNESLSLSEKMSPSRPSNANAFNESNRSISEKELEPITSAMPSDEDGVERNVPSVVSPTSGIPVFNCDYSSDEEDKKRAPLPKRNSKAVFGAQKKKSLLAKSIMNSGFISEAPSESMIFSFVSEFSSTESSDHMSSTGSSGKEPHAPVAPIPVLATTATIAAATARPPKDRRELLVETRDVNSMASVELNADGLNLLIAPSVDSNETPRSKSEGATAFFPAIPSVPPSFMTAAQRVNSKELSSEPAAAATAAANTGAAAATISATTDSIVVPTGIPPAPQSKRRHSSTGVVSLSNAGGSGAAFDFKKASPINRYAAQKNYDLSKVVNVAHLESKTSANTPPQTTNNRPSPPSLTTPRKTYFPRRSVSPKPPGLLGGSGSGSGAEADGHSLSGDDKSSPETKRSPTPSRMLPNFAAAATLLTPLKDPAAMASSSTKDNTPKMTAKSPLPGATSPAPPADPTSARTESAASGTSSSSSSASGVTNAGKKDGTPPKIPTSKEGDGNSSGEKKKPSPSAAATASAPAAAAAAVNASSAGNSVPFSSNSVASAPAVPSLAVKKNVKIQELKVESEEDSEDKSSDENDEDEEEYDEEDAMCQAQDVSDSLTETLKTVPLKTLGKACLEVLNRQQLQTLKTMWSMLRNGVAMLKHGRNGKPKFKALFCDVNMTKLYWRSPGSKADPDQDDSDVEIDTLYLGSIVPKNRYHMPKDTKHSRRTTAFTKTDADRVILFREILEVKDDCSTEVMKRSLAKNYLVNNGSHNVISIVMDDRTLDFEIDESKWGAIYHALQILVMYYHTITPGRFGSVQGSTHDFPGVDSIYGGSGGNSVAAAGGGAGFGGGGLQNLSGKKDEKQRPSYPFGTISYDSDPPDSPSAGEGQTDGASAAGTSASGSYIGQNKTIFTTNRKKKAKRLSIGSAASDS